MSVDGGEQDDVQMGNEPNLEVRRISINRKLLMKIWFTIQRRTISISQKHHHPRRRLSSTST
jgi:hypothetical protein